MKTKFMMKNKFIERIYEATLMCTNLIILLKKIRTTIMKITYFYGSAVAKW